MTEASNLDPTALIEMTAEIVSAYVTKNHVRAAELPELIAIIHASLAGMGNESGSRARAYQAGAARLNQEVGDGRLSHQS